ncbi:MAG: hypothetical protein ACM31C_25770 [Acidobacteriota bacterium]
MKKVLGLVLMVLAACAAENAPATSTTADTLSIGQPMFARINSTQNPQQPTPAYFYRIHSVASFDSAFSYQGVTYPYTMVGTPPAQGGTTIVPTVVVPTRFTFAGGLVLDGNDSVPGTLASPVFQTASYSTGTTQFGDAVQRAEFWNQMSTTYHVQLGRPVVQRTLDVAVPADRGFAFPVGPDQYIGFIDIDWFYGTVRGMLGPAWKVDQFPIVLSHNVFLYIGDPSQCCVLGFHDAYLTGYNRVLNKFDAQTWAWASYSDPGFFGPVPISDVHALSHEVSEWMNDPFTYNVVPPWQGNQAYGCSNALETGDPLVGHAYPVTTGGHTYYPQTQALLPWFERLSPSNAIDGAYSYPDETALTQLPYDCTLQ